MRVQGFAKVASREGGCLVKVDGKELRPQRSLRLRNHSPTGFSWGYHGSGPAQLALALLLEAGVDQNDALDWYHHFKQKVVGCWLYGQDFDEEIDIQAWVQRMKAAHQPLDERLSER